MRRPWILAGFLVTAVVLFGCLPLVLGRAAPIWDAGTYFGPHFALVADYVKSGRLELWNPWINAGAPDLAEPQLGTASPALLVFALVAPNPFSGFIAYWLAVWIFGGIGMILLCRHLGSPAWGAAVIALGFVACGVYTGNAEHTSFIYSFSFLPWIVWRFDKSLEQRSHWFMIQAAVLWGLSAQGGYPGVTITAAIFLGLWGFGKAPLTRLVVALVIFCGVGFAVMSPAYVSFLKENRGYSYRADGLERQYALGSNALPPAAFASVANPALYLLRRPDQRVIWPEADVSMTNVYMGVLVVVLALAALARPSKWRVWLACVAVFFGCCAVGSHLPVRGWLYDLVPPTRYFRHPALFRMYVIVSACVLAAYATRDMETNRRRSSRGPWGGAHCLVSALAAVAALLVYAGTKHGVDQSVGADRQALAQLLLTWPLAAVIFFLAWRGRLSRALWPAALVMLAAGDAASTLAISGSTIYDGALGPWRAMAAGHVSSVASMPGGWARSLFPPESVEETRNNRNVALKAATFNSRVPMKNTLFTHYLDDPSLSRIATGSDRIWFSDRPVWLAPTEANFAAFSSASHASGFPALVLHTPDDMAGRTSGMARPMPSDPALLQTMPLLAAAHADLIVYSPNELTFRYRADRDGWLLVTDRWASSWTVQVNGRDQAVLGGDFVFRAVAVIRGDNLIEFRYQPRGYFYWVALSWSTLAIVAIWQLWRARRPRPATASQGR